TSPTTPNASSSNATWHERRQQSTGWRTDEPPEHRRVGDRVDFLGASCALSNTERRVLVSAGLADARNGCRLRGTHLLRQGGRVTIGSDQLDAWGKTLIEADNLYRELQLLIRINPEAYTVDSTALAAVGV